MISQFSSVCPLQLQGQACESVATGTGRSYVPILVRTGVFRGPQENSAEFPADLVVPDVDAAVAAALHRERGRHWHSMR